MKQPSLTVRSKLAQSSLWLLIPLALSAFTHLWNPIGFPYMHGDEGHYMRRAMQILHGFGPQEPISVYDSPYDHPYFGQLFLASVLGIIGYPSSLHPTTANSTDAIHSIEMLYTVPRVLMGLLAILDTFLIYKISEVRYNRKVAFIASVLFAVMPLSWLTRRILLDSIQLPFLLLSILFAVLYYNKKNNSSSSLLTSSSRTISSFSSSSSLTAYEKSNKNNDNKKEDNKNILLVILSGIFLGLAIFTKIPVFTMIPLVGFIIISSSSSSSSATNKNNNQNNNSNAGTSSTITKRLGTNIITKLRNLNFKALGIWFIPVILIPLIWPAYNILTGQFDDWLHGVLWQVGEREGRGIFKLSTISFKLDPVLFVLGIAGLVFATVIKRDWLPFLWLAPFLIFHFFITFVQHFHSITILPVICIAAAVMMTDLLDRINNKNKNMIWQTILPYAIISAIAIFGLVSTSMLITTNVNSSYFQVYAFIVQHLPDISNNSNNITKPIMMGSNWMQEFSWIPKYIFNKDHDFKGFYGKNLPVTDKKVLLLVDGNDYKRYILKDEEKITKQKQLYINTRQLVKFKGESAKFDYDTYPYTSMKESRGIGRIEIRVNY